LRVGVIGTGIMGQNHIRTYSKIKGVELAGIADVDRGTPWTRSAKSTAARGILTITSCSRRAWMPSASWCPRRSTGRWRLNAISAGANLMVEKPIADTVLNAECIVEAARRENVRLMVGHIERFNPAVVKDEAHHRQRRAWKGRVHIDPEGGPLQPAHQGTSA